MTRTAILQRFILPAIFAAPLFLAACDSAGPEDDPDPIFEVSTITVQLANGTPGI